MAKTGRHLEKGNLFRLLCLSALTFPSDLLGDGVALGVLHVAPLPRSPHLMELPPRGLWKSQSRFGEYNDKKNIFCSIVHHRPEPSAHLVVNHRRTREVLCTRPKALHVTALDPRLPHTV